jgi:GrpB-like predicted nucleotidyltransferase (UPF0157 family)
VADQTVDIVRYDPVWPALFAAEQSKLALLLSPWLAAPVEHIGSTSIPGLAAKPVVDILAVVTSLAKAQASIAVLEKDGWLFWADDPNRDYRLWFLRPHPEARTHHLHVIQYDHAEAQALIKFRDVLRRDIDLCRRYAELKAELAMRHKDNRNAYTNAKARFVHAVLKSVGVELQSHTSLPE